MNGCSAFFEDGALRWCPPQDLIGRPGTKHIAPDSGYWYGKAWQSKDFIRVALPVYRNVIEWAEKQDWWFYHPLDQEHQLFSVWFAHAIGIREYSNPLIHDLYVFHDLLHAYTFIDAPGDTTERWKVRMRANEIMTSLETEVLFYHRCPSLREKSFSNEIWADRWLPEGVVGRASDFGVEMNNQEELLLSAASLWPLVIPAMFSGLWWVRRRASLNPSFCPHEQQIALYEKRAEQYYQAWGEQWREIEVYRQDKLIRMSF